MRYFKGKQFKKDIILVAVGYYCRFSLSYRNVSELLNERGIFVRPTTIMPWLHKYGTLIYQIWKKKKGHSVWHLDETYIKVKGEWCYLYRVIDGDGHTLDIQLRRTRDHQAAYMFMKRLVNQQFLLQTRLLPYFVRSKSCGTMVFTSIRSTVL